VSAIGRHIEAIDCYNKAIEINPLDAAALTNKGIELDELGNYEEAIIQYDKAIDVVQS
jgi:protein O-GlcNAc transferase